MATYRLDIAYDGRAFRGWARQPDERTVQGEIERALLRLFSEPVELTVAGRTDSGVHATGQVASFSTDAEPPATFLRALNSLTPRDIAIEAVERVPGTFDARRDATARHYLYRVETGPVLSPFDRDRAWHYPYPVDLALLERCAQAITGVHDFTAFTPTETEHVHFHRDILAAGWQRETRPDVHRPPSSSILAFRVSADAFMRNMVRILVGTQLEVARGKRSLDSFVALLDGAERPEAGVTAPPEGLYLEAVSYE